MPLFWLSQLRSPKRASNAAVLLHLLAALYSTGLPDLACRDCVNGASPDERIVYGEHLALSAPLRADFDGITPGID